MGVSSTGGGAPQKFSMEELGFQPPAGFQETTDPKLEGLKKSLDSLDPNKVTVDQLIDLQVQAKALENDPKLPPADKAVVEEFVKNLNNAIGEALATGHSESGGGKTVKYTWQDLKLPPSSMFDTSQSTQIKNLQKFAASLEQQTLIAKDLVTLKEEALLILSGSAVTSTDKTLLEEFVKNVSIALDKVMEASTGSNKLEALKQTPQYASGSTQGQMAPVLNKFLQVNAVVDSFINTTELAKIYIKIMRQDSLLAQKLNMGIIAMAKEMYRLGIQAGDAEAASYMADAAKYWADFGVAMGKIATTSMSMAGKAIGKYSLSKQALKEMKDKDPTITKLDFSTRLSINRQVSEDWHAFDTITDSVGSAAGAVAGGITSVIKADAAKQRALAESTKNFLSTVMGIMQDTVRKLDEDKQGASDALRKLWDLVSKLQDTSVQQWRS